MLVWRSDQCSFHSIQHRPFSSTTRTPNTLWSSALMWVRFCELIQGSAHVLLYFDWLTLKMSLFRMGYGSHKTLGTVGLRFTKKFARSHGENNNRVTWVTEQETKHLGCLCIWIFRLFIYFYYFFQSDIEKRHLIEKIISVSKIYIFFYSFQGDLESFFS